jgi:hypothetical protein
MKNYSKHEIFERRAVEILYRATELVKRIPAVDRGGKYWRCHEVARLARGWTKPVPCGEHEPRGEFNHGRTCVLPMKHYGKHGWCYACEREGAACVECR